MKKINTKGGATLVKKMTLSRMTNDTAYGSINGVKI
jgi:hypothetical protein